MGGQFLGWDRLREDDIREMITQHFKNLGYKVVDVHGHAEQGADLVCERKDNEMDSVIVLVKRTPGQKDLGQITTAKRNYKGRFEYYYSGKASGPFISGVQDEHPDVQLIAEQKIEKLMIDHNNPYFFYYLFKYSIFIDELTKFINFIFETCDNDQESPQSKLVNPSDILDFFEGVLQLRQLTTTSLGTMRRVADTYDIASENAKGVIVHVGAEIANSYINEGLKLIKEKLSKIKSLPTELICKYFYGYDCWGTTYSRFFGKGEFGDDEHRERVRYYLLEEGYDFQFQSGLSQACGCLMSIQTTLDFLKRGARSGMNATLNN